MTTTRAYNRRGARVDPLIRKAPIEQSVFKVAVRHAYASGMPIVVAVEVGLQTIRARYPDFNARYDGALLDLPK